MANLVSPGVQVQVIDESFYADAGPGTVPLIFIATEENKPAADGSGIAEGTLKENAGDLYLITSQRELLNTFGLPEFKDIAGTQQHGYELNEYGLLAAHSYLGIANRALVVRGDIDLAQLEPSTVAPDGTPSAGTYWLDTSESNVGLFEWDDTDSEWQALSLYTITDENMLDSGGAPLTSYPAPVGAYAYVAGTAQTGPSTFVRNRVYRRAASSWELIDNAAIAEDFQYAPHTQVPNLQSDGVTALADGDLWLKTTEPDGGTYFTVKYYDSQIGQFVEVEAPIRETRNGALLAYGGEPQSGDLFVHYDFNNSDEQGFANSWEGDPANAVAEFAIMRHNGEAETEAVGSVDLTASPVTTGGDMTINGDSITINVSDEASDVVTTIINANIANITAYVGDDNNVVVVHENGQDIEIIDTTNTPSTELGLDGGFTDVTNGTIYSNWDYLVYEATGSSPSTDPAEGTLWYNNDLKVDILENDGEGSWQEFSGTIYLQPAAPDSGVLSQGDLWIDTDSMDDYPVINRWNGVEFVDVDNTDQTSPQGIVFGDARPSPTFGSDSGVNNGGGSAPDLDADVPDPLLYPRDMLLFNTRYSTNNVKEWIPDYTFEGTEIGDRWVTRSGNRADGSPYMGRDAVKIVIVEALAAVMANNEDIRAESVFFNLMAAPGFPELIDEMVTLNVDRKETAFIVGDTPFRLEPTGTSLQNWATNEAGAVSNGEDGLLTADTYLGLYYPSAFTTNLTGEEVVAPASHIALRTIAYNDQVAYPWFAPAGYQRGVVNNAVNVGYVDDEDEFVPVELNEGQRDVLYLNNINPIAFRPNQGLVVFGQKTRHPLSSALDRVNVARLVNYIRWQAPQLAEPFLFEPNDDITRRAVTRVFERFLDEIVTLRGITDFAVICSDVNNTPQRIDRNELWIDLVIIPTRAIEFIYIPVRIRNTGADLSLQQNTSGNPGSGAA